MRTTKLSTLINRMSRYQTALNIAETDKVYDLDEALRTIRREVNPPWTLIKSTLRVFSDVLEYSVASDHDELAFLRDARDTRDSASNPNFRYTSIKEFYENPDDRNDLAEIWKSGTKSLGVRYDRVGLSSQKITADLSDTSLYTASGDASALTVDTVNTKNSANSMQFTVTNSSGTATVEASTTAVNDSNYVKKYFFMEIYLDSAPTSLVLRFGNDSSNYLYSDAITTQFDGSTFIADDWNLVAFDLNTANTQGTISSSTFDYYAVVLTGAASGTYNISNAYLREWILMDYWYYSRYNCKTNSASVADQEFFRVDSTQAYSTDTTLVGDDEWADVIMYDALFTGVSDKENPAIAELVGAKREEAWRRFFAKYPDLVPIITTSSYLFSTFMDESWLEGAGYDLQ